MEGRSGELRKVGGAGEGQTRHSVAGGTGQPMRIRRGGDRGGKRKSTTLEKGQGQVRTSKDRSSQVRVFGGQRE